MSLTPSQAAVLHFLHSYIAANGYPPTITEVTYAVRLRSRATAAQRLTELRELGYIRCPPGMEHQLVVVRGEP